MADRLASEYLRLLDEGWDPDLDEFLGRVPNDEMAALRRLQEHDQLKLERRFFDECMRANGYRRAGGS